MTRLRSAFLAIRALLALAFAVLAQPAPGVFTVGLLLPAAATSDWRLVFIKHMSELGYEQGRNLTLVERTAKQSNAELPALAAELAAIKPDALAALGTAASLALKRATANIPIVAIAIGDPIGSHLVESLAHPGGNVTGTAIAADGMDGQASGTDQGNLSRTPMRAAAAQSGKSVHRDARHVGEQIGGRVPLRVAKDQRGFR